MLMPSYAHRRPEPQGEGVWSLLWAGKGKEKMGRDRKGRENKDRGTFDADPTSWEGVGLLTPDLVLQIFL